MPIHEGIRASLLNGSRLRRPVGETFVEKLVYRLLPVRPNSPSEDLKCPRLSGWIRIRFRQIKRPTTSRQFENGFLPSQDGKRYAGCAPGGTGWLIPPSGDGQLPDQGFGQRPRCFSTSVETDERCSEPVRPWPISSEEGPTKFRRQHDHTEFRLGESHGQRLARRR